MKYLFNSFLLLVMTQWVMVATPTVVAADRAILILDASGSMWGDVDGKPKIEIARTVISEMIQNWDDSIELGLMVYGHRQKADCEDIELVIPPGPVDRSLFLSKIQSIIPRGKTPLTRSVLMAAEALQYTEERATVILVSDGIETCDLDPCAAAEELAAKGIDFKAHVIGFDLTDEDQRQIDCLANKTGGVFLAAKNASELKKALSVATSQMSATPQPAPPVPAPVTKAEPPAKPSDGNGSILIRPLLVEGGDPVGAYAFLYLAGSDKSVKGASTSHPFRVPPGTYDAQIKWGDVTVRAEVGELAADQDLVKDILLNAGIVTLSTFAEEGGEAVQGYYHIETAAKDLQGKAQQVAAGSGPSFKLPVGDYLATSKWGEARASTSFSITAGDITEASIVLGAGTVTLTTLTAEGGESVKPYYHIHSAQKDLQGKSQQVAAGSGPAFKIPAGEYVATAKWGQAQATAAFTVTSGQTTEATVILNAGILKLSTLAAEGGEAVKPYYTIKSAQKDLAGKQSTIAAGSNDQFQLPNEDVIVQAKWGQASTELAATVKANEMTEATLILNAGVLNLSALDGEGGPQVKPYFLIKQAQPGLDGKHVQITAGSQNQFNLPAGNYLISVDSSGKQGSVEAEVKPGQSTDATLILRDK
jgi:Ca-activated chloride channel family protein